MDVDGWKHIVFIFNGVMKRVEQDFITGSQKGFDCGKNPKRNGAQNTGKVRKRVWRATPTEAQ